MKLTPMKYIQQSRSTVLAAYQRTGDITILHDFAFLAEAAGFQYVADSMYQRIDRINASLLRRLVEAVRPVAQDAEARVREAVMA